jgi:hypothetical protein
MTWVAAASTSGCALATAQEVPAQESKGRSFGMSPNATTAWRPIPCRAASSATAVALLTPVATASIRPVPLECVTATRPSTTGAASASSSSGVYAMWRPSSLAAGRANSTASPSRAISTFRSKLIEWNTLSAAHPSGYSTPIPMPGTAVRSARAAAASCAGAISGPAVVRPVRMS